MNKPKLALEAFGEILREQRHKTRIGLREICRTLNYDPSNWSKIEQGKISPPADEKILSKWAEALGIQSGSERQHFVDTARVAQGLIPKIPSEKEMVKLLPAFFRTVRKGKPSKRELDDLLKLLKETL